MFCLCQAPYVLSLCSYVHLFIIMYMHCIMFDNSFVCCLLQITMLYHPIAILADITDDVINPLLLSAVTSQSRTSDFTNAVLSTLKNITNALNGSNVNLTRTLNNYLLAVSRVYSNEAIDSSPVPLTLSATQRNCVAHAVFDHINTNANASSELIELFHNISRAISIIKRVRVCDCRLWYVHISQLECIYCT